MHDGDFDNTYYSGEYQYGYLYFCGKNPGTSLDNPAIERVFFNSSGILGGLDGSFLNVSGVDAAECSPVTEVYNAGIDYMFFSVQTVATRQTARLWATERPVLILLAAA